MTTRYAMVITALQAEYLKTSAGDRQRRRVLLETQGARRLRPIEEEELGRLTRKLEGEWLGVKRMAETQLQTARSEFLEALPGSRETRDALTHPEKVEPLKRIVATSAERDLRHYAHAIAQNHDSVGAYAFIRGLADREDLDASVKEELVAVARKPAVEFMQPLGDALLAAKVAFFQMALSGWDGGIAAIKKPEELLRHAYLAESLEDEHGNLRTLAPKEVAAAWERLGYQPTPAADPLEPEVALV